MSDEQYTWEEEPVPFYKCGLCNNEFPSEKMKVKKINKKENRCCDCFYAEIEASIYG